MSVPVAESGISPAAPVRTETPEVAGGRAPDRAEVLACLRAAKRGLVRLETAGYKGLGACPGSEWPHLAWGAAASWNPNTINKAHGGPWPVEFVAALCRRGWLGIHPERPDAADITRAGRAALKALAGESPSPPKAEGESQ